MIKATLFHFFNIRASPITIRTVLLIYIKNEMGQILRPRNNTKQLGARFKTILQELQQDVQHIQRKELTSFKKTIKMSPRTSRTFTKSPRNKTRNVLGIKIMHNFYTCARLCSLVVKCRAFSFVQCMHLFLSCFLFLSKTNNIKKSKLSRKFGSWPFKVQELVFLKKF